MLIKVKGKTKAAARIYDDRNKTAVFRGQLCSRGKESSKSPNSPVVAKSSKTKLKNGQIPVPTTSGSIKAGLLKLGKSQEVLAKAVANRKPCKVRPASWEMAAKAVLKTSLKRQDN